MKALSRHSRVDKVVVKEEDEDDDDDDDEDDDEPEQEELSSSGEREVKGKDIKNEIKKEKKEESWDIKETKEPKERKETKPLEAPHKTEESMEKVNYDTICTTLSLLWTVVFGF